ncbi:MAG: ABC transporter substrate-binding protein, partial [Acetobacteraceae bacterium]
MHRTRRGLIGAAGALVAAGAASAAEPPRPAASGIVLGALFPLTGRLALAGDESLRGLELAVAEQNHFGGLHGQRLHLVVADAADP